MTLILSTIGFFIGLTIMCWSNLQLAKQHANLKPSVHGVDYIARQHRLLRIRVMVTWLVFVLGTPFMLAAIWLKFTGVAS